MFDYLTQTSVINLKEWTVGSIDYLGWKLGIEFEIELTDGDELNFDKPFLHFNVKKKIFAKVIFTLIVSIESSALLA